MKRLAGRFGPRSIHQVAATNAGGERKTAGKRLAEANEIGSRVAVLAGEARTGAVKARVDFIEDEDGAEFIGERT